MHGHINVKIESQYKKHNLCFYVGFIGVQ